jgi:hypothetical protein
MLPPLPRRSVWAYYFARSPNRVSLPRKGHRVGLRIVLFEACSAFTRVAACTLAPSPIRDAHSEGFSHFVTSMTAPIASDWSGCRVGLAPTGKRRLVTAHTHLRHWRLQISAFQTDRCRPSRRSQNSVLVARVEVQKYTPDRFPHRRLDRQIEKMIQRLFTKATR